MPATEYDCQHCDWRTDADVADVAEAANRAIDHHVDTGHSVEYTGPGEGAFEPT